jgi:hypothetical protein
LATPFATWNPSPLFESFSLTYLEIPPCSGANSHPLLPLVGSKLNLPQPPLSPSLTLTVPFVQCMPSQDDIAISASIVRYSTVSVYPTDFRCNCKRHSYLYRK